MSADEKDDVPVNATHVRDFLAWYQQRNGMKGIDVSPEWWTNALRTLSLGELRNGIRSYSRFSSALHLSPVEFWNLCRGRQDEKSIERFRALRAAVRGAPPIPKPKKETRDANPRRPARTKTAP